MTGVQTCALPICFPVTIGGGVNASDTVEIIHKIETQGSDVYVYTSPKFSGIFIAFVDSGDEENYTWTEYEIADSGAWQAKSGGKNSTDNGTAQEFQQTQGLAATPFYTFMFELTSADGSKFYRFKQDVRIPIGTADGQIYYWDETNKCIALGDAPTGNDIPYWNTTSKTYKFLAPAQYKVLTSTDGTSWEVGYVRSHS